MQSQGDWSDKVESKKMKSFNKAKYKNAIVRLAGQNTLADSLVLGELAEIKNEGNLDT